jgi:hypothetical protein
MLRIRLYRTVTFGFVLVVSAIAWRVSAAPPHPSLPVPGRIDGLGTNIHFTDPRPGEMQMLADGGFRWIRMDFVWGATERQRQQYDFSAYERLLTALERHQIRALFILDYSNPLYEADRSVATEEGRQAYARWAAAAAQRFAGRGILWEIWNEPNIRGFWQPEPNVQDYTAMALAAARAIRDVAPGEAIVGPATSTIDLRFLEGCFQAGLLEWWDAVSVHPYRRPGPETAAAEYHQLRRLIEQYAPAGKSIPILSGEWGYSSAWDGFDEQRQGKLLPRQWLINMAHGIPVSIWYDWHDDGRDPHEAEHHFGTVSYAWHEGRSPVYDPKPAYLAARTLTTALDGFQFDKRLATGHPDDYVLLFRQGQRTQLAAWTLAAEPREISIPSDDGRWEAVSHTGENLGTVTAGGGSLKLTVSDAPQYLAATGANALLDQIPAARELRATLIPGPGRVLTVQLENLSNTPFRGTARLVDVAGLEPQDLTQPVDLEPGETDEALRFRLAAGPDAQCRVGLQIEDPRGQVILHLPARRFVHVPDPLLARCRIVTDGDPQVPAESSLAVADPPRPLPGSEANVLRIDYRFGEGWRFLRVVPSGDRARDIDGQPAGFGLWIYGDGQGTSPRLRVRDATGQTWQPTAPQIDWTGWRYAEFPLTAASGHWGGAEDGVIHYPLVWDSLFLLDNPSREPNEGTVYITAPVVLYGETSDD